MAPLQEALLRVVMRVFERGTPSPSDRLDLNLLHGKAALDVTEVEDVFRELLRATWGDVIDDEALTSDDWARLAVVVDELRLPRECIPFPEALDIAV